MLRPEHKLALYLEGAWGKPEAKMAYGILRYSPNPVACILDSQHAGRRTTRPGIEAPPVPIVASFEEAVQAGAQVLVLGTATSGGRIPEAWFAPLQQAVNLGLSVVNGMHDRLAGRWPLTGPEQWVWDVRTEPIGLGIACRRAMDLRARRVLFVGTDMAVGKMTAALELDRQARGRGVRSAFVATGQTGICIHGRGVALDAVRVDYAAGAVEAAVLACPEDAEVIWVEGQGALGHPGSTSTLPLLRGSCPTHLILCHRAGQPHLRHFPAVSIPPLPGYIALYEQLAATCGLFPDAKVIGVCLNTAHLDLERAEHACAELTQALERPVIDPVRQAPDALLDAVLR